MKNTVISEISPSKLPDPTASIRRIRPKKSSRILALIAAAPTSVFKTFKSIKSLAVIPILVAVRITPPTMDSLVVYPNLERTIYPKINGNSAPNTAATIEIYSVFFSLCISISSPLKNNKNIMPTVDKKSNISFS